MRVTPAGVTLEMVGQLPLGHFVAIIYICYHNLLVYCSRVWGVSCWMSPSASRAASVIRCPGFALIIVACRCVIDVTLLGYGCCTRLIQTRITLCSVSFHVIPPEFDILELRSLLIHWSLPYQGVERPNSQGDHCHRRFECGMTFPIYTMSDTGTLTGSNCARVMSTVGPWFEFSPWFGWWWGCEINLWTILFIPLFQCCWC